MSYSIIERGSPYTFDYRIFFAASDVGFISPFHDIPLFANEEKTVFNMVVEVPRWTNAKMEISKDDKLNPIKQDVKKGKLRYVDNCFPHHGYIWNYGALPQTWEDPNVTDEYTGQKGDNDPIDVCEIGNKIHKRGEVLQVKVLGIMALIDEGETDWKVLAIDVSDPLAEVLNDVSDIEEHMPGLLMATNEWFRIYKIPTGKPENKFAFEGKARSKDFAYEIIQQSHDQWQNLILKKVESETETLSCVNTTVEGSPYLIGDDEAKSIVDVGTVDKDSGTGVVPEEVNKWHFIRL